MAEISIVEIRQGPVGPAGSPANVTQANMEAAITDAEAFRAAVGIYQVPLSAFAVSDTDLAIEATTTGVDQSDAIQAALDIALTRPLHLLWDVKVTVKNLIVHPNTTIAAVAGCGAKLANNAEVPLLQNANCKALADQVDGYNNPDFEEISRDKNIQILGGVWHGNAANQLHDTPEEGWNVPLRFFNVEDFVLKPEAILKPRTFAFHGFNLLRFDIDAQRIDVGTTGGFNYDGVHINGNSSQGRIRMGNITAQDDALGLNADDVGTVLQPFATGGPITDILVEQMHMAASGLEGIRLLSGTSRVDRILIRNVTGSNAGPHIKLDNYAEDPSDLHFNGPGNFGTVVLDGWDVLSTRYDTSVSGAANYQNGIILCAEIEALIVRNSRFTQAPGELRSPCRVLEDTTIVDPDTSTDIGLLRFENCEFVIPDGEAAVAREIVRVSGAANIDRLELIACRRRAMDTVPRIADVLVRTEDTATVGVIVIDGFAGAELLGELSHESSAASPDLVIRNSNIPWFQYGATPAARTVSRVANTPDSWRFARAATGVIDAYGPPHAKLTNCYFKAIVSADSWADIDLYFGTRSPAYSYTSATSGAYCIRVNATSFGLFRNIGGLVAIGSAVAIAPVANEEYELEVRCFGTTISGFVRRISTGLWLQSGATWSSTRAAFASGTDATYNSTGWPLIQRYTLNASRAIILRAPEFGPAYY